MNIKIITLLLLILLVSFATATAQTKEEKRVAEAVETLRQAMINGDRARLEKIADQSLTYGHSGGHIDDKKEFVEKLASGISDFVSITLSEQTITILGNTAIVRHNLSADTNDSGKPGQVKLKVLLVWAKIHRQWKLIARQAVKPS